MEWYLVLSRAEHPELSCVKTYDDSLATGDYNFVEGIFLATH